MAHELRPGRKLARHRGALLAVFPRAPDRGRHTGRNVGQPIQRPARQPLAARAKTRTPTAQLRSWLSAFHEKGRGGARRFAPRESDPIYGRARRHARRLHPTPSTCGLPRQSPHPAPGQAARRARSQAMAPRRHRSRRSGAHPAVGLGVYKTDSPLLRARGFTLWLELQPRRRRRRLPAHHTRGHAPCPSQSHARAAPASRRAKARRFAENADRHRTVP
jgi:hypothetical protein